MSKKTKAVVVLPFMVSIFAVLCIGLASCSNKPLANTTWQDAEGARKLTFTESTFRWTNKDTGYDRMGIYTISKDAIILSFDAGINQTGSFINGTLSITANPGYADEEHIEFHRVR